MQRCLGYNGQRCGVLLTTGRRCVIHERMVNTVEMKAARRRRPDLYLSKPERARRAAAVAQWRATYGDYCPGWARPGHAAANLTADHLIAVVEGGDPRGILVVLCALCNSTKDASRRRHTA